MCRRPAAHLPALAMMADAGMPAGVRTIRSAPRSGILAAYSLWQLMNHNLLYGTSIVGRRRGHFQVVTLQIFRRNTLRATCRHHFAVGCAARLGRIESKGIQEGLSRAGGQELALRSRCSHQPFVQCDKQKCERLRDRHIPRVVTRHGMAQLPNAVREGIEREQLDLELHQIVPRCSGLRRRDLLGTL
jgi:hypothetical protein